jgi:hypothetical protein
MPIENYSYMVEKYEPFTERFTRGELQGKKAMAEDIR